MKYQKTKNNSLPRPEIIEVTNFDPKKDQGEHGGFTVVMDGEQHVLKGQAGGKRYDHYLAAGDLICSGYTDGGARHVFVMAKVGLKANYVRCAAKKAAKK